MSDFSCIDWVNFGQEVKAARSFLGWSKEALARAAHVAPATVSRVEDGASDVGAVGAGTAIQNALERKGIEFPSGTWRVAVAYHGENGLTGIAVTSDSSMPAGVRFMWPSNQQRNG